MAAKSGFSFGFSKKAEPKKYVAALAVKKVDDREEIRGLQEGQLELEKPKIETLATIKCKNPLDATRKLAAKPVGEQKPKLVLEDCAGGLVTKNIAKLSSEDAEAMRELLKDAAKEDDGEDAPAAAPVPILMGQGSKKVREGYAPEATREMFDNVSVDTFGEAMLRGMGYDPGVHATKPIFRDKLRDNCLGLGAKALLPGEKEKISSKKKAAPVQATASRALSGCRSVTGSASGIAAAAVDETDTAEATPSAASAVSSEPAQKRPRTEDADAAEQGKAAVDVWASRGLVVKVISKEGDLRDFFGVEAVVLEVDEVKCVCRIKARPNGSDKSQQLSGIPLPNIETRVSRDCQKVRIVRGPQKGVVAKLAKRDVARGKAVLLMDDVESEMSLDDVCQFMG